MKQLKRGEIEVVGVVETANAVYGVRPTVRNVVVAITPDGAMVIDRTAARLIEARLRDDHLDRLAEYGNVLRRARMRGRGESSHEDETARARGHRLLHGVALGYELSGLDRKGG